MVPLQADLILRWADSLTIEITISEFKANCSKLLEQVRLTRHSIRITRRGKPVAEIVPCSSSPLMERKAWFGSMKGSITIKGDIISPANDEDEWECLRG